MTPGKESTPDNHTQNKYGNYTSNNQGPNSCGLNSTCNINHSIFKEGVTLAYGPYCWEVKFYLPPGIFSGNLWDVMKIEPTFSLGQIVWHKVSGDKGMVTGFVIRPAGRLTYYVTFDDHAESACFEIELSEDKVLDIP